MHFQVLIATASLLFVLGLWGVALNRKNILTIILAIELMLLGANFHFLILSVLLRDIKRQIFSLFILTIAAAESAIRLSILIVCHRQHKTIQLDSIFNLYR